MHTEPVTQPAPSRKDRRTFLVITVVIAALLGGVAVNNYATNQQTLDNLAAARSDVAALEEDKNALSSALDGVTTERDELVALLDDATSQLDDTTTQLLDAHADNEALVEERDDALAAEQAAKAETVALREQYDPQIAAERQAAHDAGVAADCASSIDAGAILLRSWDDDFASLDGVDRQTYEAAVDACATPVIAQGVRGRCQDPVDVEQVVRDPDAFTGDCVELVVDIVQFDQATGPCGFRAYFDTTAHRWSHQYKGDNGIFAAADPARS
ncbi:hypothetical protein [Euzebya rosea]|uniref:hypothetical protein n=1 Tax=Euzebya rosea TaxID=2052804 RepID=UPI000D3EBCA9|nr:hypothetical protein [Euzebya rosea]